MWEKYGKGSLRKTKRGWWAYVLRQRALFTTKDAAMNYIDAYVRWCGIWPP